MRLIATTVVRESLRGKQKTGYIYDVDWPSREIRRRLPVPDPSFPESDDNPRGGVRGGRGVTVTRHGIVVANYDTFYVYDDDWNVLHSFSHSLLVGIHEIDWDGSHIWAAATGIDAVVRATQDGAVEAVWDPHAADALERYGLRARPNPLDGSVDYRVRQAPLIDECHLNGVARTDGGVVVNCGLVRRRKPAAKRMLRRLNRRLRQPEQSSGPRHSGSSLVIRVQADGEASVLCELKDHDFPTHNGQLLRDGRLILNDSTQNTLRLFDLDAGAGAPRELLSVRIPGKWLRGLEPVDGTRVLIGSAPARLVLVDVTTGSIESEMPLSEDPNEAVHGLVLCPPVAERI
jgi:hypothetical protein